MVRGSDSVYLPLIRRHLCENSRRNGGAALDERDIRLIALLEANARASLAELARALSISPQSVSERLKRLEDRRRPRASPSRSTRRSSALRSAPTSASSRRWASLPASTEIVKTIPEIVECDRITGEDCFIAKVFVAKVEHLEGVIDRLIPYARTNTSIIQSSPVPARLPKYA